ncbi:MAG: ABC transporter permease [Gemmataceae bacterium]|nr:ABC transporter permease [Gemmataceae bacterium]
MTFFRLLLRNLLYHWRGNTAVLLGIALGAAVLTGALLVGDSLRGSMKALTLDQLAWVDQAMLPGRFFRDTLAKDIRAERQASLLMLQGSASAGPKDEPQTVGKVNVLGVDSAFWPADLVPESVDLWASDDRIAVLNATLANALKVEVGDTITLRLEKADHAPRETLLGQRKSENIIVPLKVTVQRILPDDGIARFNLKPAPTPVRNAFVPIRLLQKSLGLTDQANVVLVAGASDSGFAQDLRKHLTLEDWGLRYRSPRDRALAFLRFLGVREDVDNAKLKTFKWRGHVPDELAKATETNAGVLTTQMVVDYYESARDYWSLESRRMLLDPRVVRSVEKLSQVQSADAEKNSRWKWSPSLVYLADAIRVNKVETPYAIVAGDDSMLMKDDAIVLVGWPGLPLKANVKQTPDIEIAFFTPNAKNRLELRNVSFRLHSVPKLEGVLDDPDLTPEFPGITDKVKMDDWENPPFPYDKKRIKPIDEDYWKRYRTTPKAYISLKKARALWPSRFGDTTTIQVRPGLEHPSTLPAKLLKELAPEEGGFAFQPVREQAVTASSGATDFGVLFIAFSFFLIVSALLLVGLLVRLNLDRRAGEIGLLLSVGWDHGKVRRLLLGEGMLLALTGSLLGLGGALLYADGMLKLLAASWPGTDGLPFLRLHIGPMSLAIGYVASFAVSVLTLWWANRVLGKRSPRSLLHGESGESLVAKADGGGWLTPTAMSLVFCTGGLGIIGWHSEAHELKAGLFFGSGALVLTAAIVLVAALLRKLRRDACVKPTLARLGMRNAGRNPSRSLLTVGLLASAAFLIVAVESFHKETDKTFYLKTHGSGGFTFFADGSLPVFEDVNDERVRGDYGLAPPELRRAVFYPCRVQPGDDASCLNLYKPLKPRVMSVSSEFIQRGGFAFASSAAVTNDDKANPWRLLEQRDGEIIPAIVDKNTAMWILKVGLGDTITIKNERGEGVKLRVVGLLNESIFQSEILIAESRFFEMFPRQEGFSFFLIDTDDPDLTKLPTWEKQLSTGFAKLNLDVQTTGSRLQGYVAVENMYLKTFQALGGLGLVLGAVGLAIVLLRGVWERRAELALLSALGFRAGQIAWLVLAENMFLLLAGLTAGTISAVVAVAPHLAGAGGQVLWLRIAGLLALVMLVGLTTAALAVWAAVRTPVLTALRRE